MDVPLIHHGDEEAAAFRRQEALEDLGIASRGYNFVHATAQQAIDDVANSGADVNAAVFDVHGNMGGTCTAVYVASDNANVVFLRDVLLPVDAVDVDLGDTSTEYTPLHIACEEGLEDVVVVLMERGANPNLVDNERKTPCMLAAFYNNVNCLRALASGAEKRNLTLDVNAVAGGNDECYTGKTALDIAIYWNGPESAAYLKTELGAQEAKNLTRPKRPKSAMKKGGK